MTRSRRYSLLDPRSHDESTSERPLRARRAPQQASLLDELTEPVAAPTEGGRRCAGGCSVSLDGRRAGTLYCEPRCGELLRTYGLGLEQYTKLLAAQGGVCAICQKRQVRQALAVDHAHRATRGVAAGAVRGLLCEWCNRRLLTAAKHSPELLRRAAEYLENPPALGVIGVVRKAT